MSATECEEWIARGRRHQWEGRPVDAMLCFRRASRADPRAADPHFVLGEALWQQARFADAVGAWREATRLDPTHVAAWKAQAEASLALGDDRAAGAAAQRALALAPDDARAAMIAGVVALADGAGDAAVAQVDAAISVDPGMAGVAALAGPLARALDRAVRTPARAALVARVAATTEARATGPLLALALALEDVPAEAARASLVAAMLARQPAPDDLEALRRAAVALARVDGDAAAEFAARYAAWCVAWGAPPVRPGWPRRTAGARTRVVALASGAGIEAGALAAIDGLPREAFALAVATIGAPRFALPADAAAIVLPDPPDAAAAGPIVALDADVLVDLAGLDAAVGPLLAQRPAREIWSAAPLPLAPPLADRILVDAPALGAALHAAHAARDAAADCALDAAAMDVAWTAAVRAHQQGDREAALAGYARVLDLQPRFAPAHFLAGVASRERVEATAARAAFAAALECHPRYVEARLAAADAAIDAGDAGAAAATCEEGLAASPGDARLLRALGRARLAERDGAAAADAFARALAADVTDGETHYNHGVALQMQRHFADAARAYQRALAFRPDLAAAHFNLGVLFQEQGRTDAAVAAYGEALAADPGSVAAYRNLGETLLAAGRIDAYLANFRRFEARCPDALPLAVQALTACQHAGDFAKLDRYLEGLRQDRFAPRDDAEIVDALEELLYLLLYFDVEPAELGRFARGYDAAARRVYGEPMPRPAARRPGCLRVGYLSGDLRDHVMGKMVWSAVAHHDKARFELFFYSLSAAEDEWTARFRGLADRYDVLAHADLRAAAERIAADDLDVLVDLCTHTKGANPGILARKPARVQITHVANAGTVGLSAIDFKLTDRYADVPANQEFQIETLLPMDGCVYPYRHIEPAAEHPFHRASLGIPADAVVIGAFVSPMKLSRRCLRLWRDALVRIPKARLAFSPLDPALAASYRRLAAAAGIPDDRLLFLPQGRGDAENQARYALVDFVLDPMPYGGANGTLEALDAGVPVVTLAGRRHGERTSYSILANLGVTDTVASSGGEYLELAARLASDAAFARHVRRRIRDGLRSSPLVDMPAHVRALERAYVAALAAKAPDALADAEGSPRG